MRKYLLAFTFLISVNSIFTQQLVDLELLASYTSNEINALFPIGATYDVNIYKMRYTSVDLQGNPDTLSGLIGSPVQENLAYPILLYSHGTSASWEAVPSRFNFQNSESLIAAVAAGLGYIIVAPDLLGLGDSKGIHPYLHAASEAWASYDMLKVVKTEGPEYGIYANDLLGLAGYSQGGHTSMALHRYIETESTDGYVVTAAVHSSGPYSMSGVTRDILVSDQEYFLVAYMVNIIISYQAVYGNILTEAGLSSFFKETYIPDIERLLAEEIDLFELNDLLVAKIQANHGMVSPKFMIREDRLAEILANPDDPVNLALKDNDVYDWAPQAPTRLFYCSGDDQVPFGNSTLAEETMIAKGSPDVVALNLSPTASHTQCAQPALTLSLSFLSQYLMPTTSVFDFAEEKSSQVFPNPSNGVIWIQDEQFTEGQLWIFDLYGRRVFTGNHRTSQQLDLTSLPAGTYQMIWQASGKMDGHRIVIQP